ncbi:lysophospholipid acyltransferase family protein [Marinoscillum luteum]|uniref:Lysophospholipid acyltransferase family protein n=1 Tax=Marinoscillum luteum TaxID=861051 RepID=A0ABW7NAM4_9BACT
MKHSPLPYTLYALFIFLMTSLVFVPLIALLSPYKKCHRLALKLHWYWAWSFCRMAFIRVVIEGKEHLRSDHQYIFCCNHFSFFDIPAFCLLYSAKFIGKSSLAKIPLFGFFFRNMHIPVNRSSMRSRAESLKMSKEAIDDGFNLCFFPEGGVLVKEENLPYMVSFKDGAFKLAIEKGIPIIPVTMPYNFLLLPDKTPVRFHHHRCKIIVHKPIFPKTSDDEEVKRLKAETFAIIQAELLAHHPDKVRTVG